MGESDHRRAAEVAALQLGLDLGVTLIDTAEMYGDGGAERVVGEAIRGRRDGVFVVSKVLPHNASRGGTVRAAEASLRRLGTDRMDLYLLHWRGDHPLEETLAGLEDLRRAGKILHAGVSNFDVTEMETSSAIPGGDRIAVNQVLYNVQRRGIERRLLPWCIERRIALMAYSPLDQGTLRWGKLEAVARRHEVSAAQVALAWTMRHDMVVSIPKASSPAHVRENVAAAALHLEAADLADIDADFPAPGRDVPLETA